MYFHFIHLIAIWRSTIQLYYHFPADSYAFRLDITLLNPNLILRCSTTRVKLFFHINIPWSREKYPYAVRLYLTKDCCCRSTLHVVFTISDSKDTSILKGPCWRWFKNVSFTIMNFFVLKHDLYSKNFHVLDIYLYIFSETLFTLQFLIIFHFVFFLLQNFFIYILFIFIFFFFLFFLNLYRFSHLLFCVLVI